MRKPANGSALERFFAGKGLRAAERFTWRGLDVYLAEGGPHHDNPAEFPHGYYESVYAIGQGDRILAFRPFAFDFTHDLSYTEEARRRLRLNTARVKAKEHLKNTDELLPTSKVVSRA